MPRSRARKRCADNNESSEEEKRHPEDSSTSEVGSPIPTLNNENSLLAEASPTLTKKAKRIVCCGIAQV